MHYHIMHPSSGKLSAFRKKSYPHYVTQKGKRLLKRISEAREVCNEHSVQLFHLSATRTEENIIFNTKIGKDIIWVNGVPVLHIVDVQQNFKTECS